jgi:hypothetical protein
MSGIGAETARSDGLEQLALI